ncbi:hypothetical protein BGW36DRAFT_387551 [Talaromyces proteolyticus]|uniref:Uncharacterized protein n=1 Tax=Talaromyces proteolyticus TaxID=1131652 RepID=A0AAD4KJH7_9EURO|nr:uncharacterized protein BGW36DRAFT_387551 [Talaromyces proteolyticus]KAH8692409.1 hypothetical protein BGW36DRAFT_387551 [Talaromyces proteolyticus]
MTAQYEGGGFIPNLTSPAYSIATTASTITPSHLPRQRTHPLRPGSNKESSLINHVDAQIRNINRRHAKKFSSDIDEHTDASDGPGAEGGGEKGYDSFREVVRDIERVIDVVWVSGTPSLQIPYLISVAGLVSTYLPDFPFTPKPTFRLLRKLDSVFVSLLTGEDAESGAPLSGFEGRRSVVSMTEKVRIKSIAEACRIAVIEAREREEDDDEDEEDEEEDDEMDIDREFDENRNFGVDEGLTVPGQWEMDIARIYERTIQFLGDELGKGTDLVV